ncbi:adenylate/guanylate cyclase domain-containing protein [Thermodesulfobacteriota bacterium]
MDVKRASRKLSAIFSADVKGYSRLMGEDELATIETLKKYRGLMSTFIQHFHGRIVDSPGDNLLVEFGSVVDAVECAVKIQEELKVENDELPENRRMEFRIGINLGDVVHEGERIYGDGVNIASRIEGLAVAGGICISRNVYDQVKNKLELNYEYLGEKSVKNIAEPVRVYRVDMGAQDSFTKIKEEIKLPDRPSIAVLPFLNMSGDPEQEYFSDGITEDLITDLSKISGLFVIARNSVFSYKGKAVNIEKVGRDLGVRYVLEGSVRRAKERVRITAQLVDVRTGGHIWAERYDRDLEDIFVLQDDVTQKIVSVLSVRMTEDEKFLQACKCQDTCNVEAYDYFLRGLEYFLRITKEANANARKMFDKSLEEDPRYAPALSKLGETYLNDWAYGWSNDSRLLDEALNLAKRAMDLDDTLPDAHCVLGSVYLWRREHQKAIAEVERAITLEPNNADWLATMGGTLNWAGNPDKAIGLIEKAIRLNPKHPDYYLWDLGHSFFLMEKYDEAISSFKRALNVNPNYHPSNFYLAASYSEIGQKEEARTQVTELLSKWPDGCSEAARQRLPYKNKAVLDRVLDDVAKAGLR